MHTTEATRGERSRECGETSRWYGRYWIQERTRGEACVGCMWGSRTNDVDNSRNLIKFCRVGGGVHLMRIRGGDVKRRANRVVLKVLQYALFGRSNAHTVASSCARLQFGRS